MSKQGDMNILVSVNDAFVMPLLVMLTSLFKSNTANSIVIWFLCSDISAASLAQVSDFVEECGARFESIDATMSFFDVFPTAPSISKETYLRLMAGYLLPNELDRVLWLDADLVVIGDLRTFYEQDFANNALVGCNHGDVVLPSMAEHCAYLGIEANRYINAGVLLINLRTWRAENVKGRITAIAETGYTLKYADQDLMNMLFQGRIRYADPVVYNFRTNQMVPSEIEKYVRDCGCIVHYCGKQKPWMFSDVSLGDIWCDCYRESPCGNKPLRLITRVGFSRMMQRFAESRQ